ncbi:endonuclease V isoform X3 [Arachis ipaensis]|uniref:endonuclease V isoform X3 n=1 Tax=Arachis ipaensis TaxID=130454 RepID=UPI0007AFA632|nr:endonuclease V isoform X3 [Arachis ipaensis]XP_025659431.1 endonuclease V isoform X3 [Arachis hypogaea]
MLRQPMEKPSETEEPSSTPLPDHQNWIAAQDLLREKLIREDSFTWKIPEDRSDSEEGLLRYIGGVDISFSKDDPSMACGTLVVLDLRTLQVVYEDFSLVNIRVPYVPGFLAFREAPILLEILEKMKKSGSSFYPQLLMVDGNGILHPRGKCFCFGLACHLGVEANLPTVGIGKNLHHVDGLNQSRVRELLEAGENSCKDFINLVGCSGHIWGAAMRSTQGSIKPIFISIGHRISLQTALRLVQMTCKYRVPEPIRQADIRSRDYIRKLKMNARMKFLIGETYLSWKQMLQKYCKT